MQLSEDSLRTILQAEEHQTLSFDGDGAFSREASQDGWIVYEVNTTDPDYRGYHTLRVTSETQRPVPQTWFDGYNNRFNLTSWDLTGDRRGDLSFWQTRADSPAQALDESLAERRSEPVRIVGDVTVVGGNETYRIQMDLRRADGGHQGVWLELNETALGQTLALGDQAPRSLAYNLSLEPENQLVERRDDSTWLWIGHFSTQRVEILVNEPGQTDEETTGGPNNDTADPSGDGRSVDDRGSNTDQQLGDNQTSEDPRGAPAGPFTGILASALAAVLARGEKLGKRS